MTDKPKATKSGRWQFSLRTLFVAVAFVAIGCGALVKASEAWQTVIYSTTFAVLFIAMLGGLFRRGRTRAFWAGFAVIGWSYLVLAFVFLEKENQLEKPRLATTRALIFVWQSAKRETPATARITQPPPLATSLFNPGVYPNSPFPTAAPAQRIPPNTFRFFPTPPPAAPPHYESFMDIGQYLWTLFLAYLGGILARYFYATRADES